MAKRIAVVDDDQSVCEALEDIFSSMGHEVRTFPDFRRDDTTLIDEDFDLILLDMHMPDIAGADVAEQTLKARPSANILVITAHPGDEQVVRALAAGARGVLRKPFEIAKIYDFLERNDAEPAH